MERQKVNRRWLPLLAATMALHSVELRAQEPALPRPVQVQPPVTASSEPVSRPPLATLRPGTTVRVRIRQVFPCDGLSPGERLLNGRQPIQPGDRFLAEVINPTSNPLPLVGGTIVKVTPPGKFGRPGPSHLANDRGGGEAAMEPRRRSRGCSIPMTRVPQRGRNGNC